MRYFVLSDIHTDLWFPKAVERGRWECYDPHESVIRDTLDYIWKLRAYPTDVDGIIVPGDVTNDFQSTCYTIKWLSEKYKEVYLVPGNHDMTVRGGTPSRSNLQFQNSYEKLNNIENFCYSLGNCKYLDSSMYNGIAGTMGFPDFKCCTYGPEASTRMKLYWQRRWYDGKFWRLSVMDPDTLWADEAQRIHDLITQDTKVLVTHYTPIQCGITSETRNDPMNAFFFFDAEEFLEEFDHDAYWLCGHVHDARKAVYTNAKGFKITILCNPNGYPEDPHDWVYEPKIERGQLQAVQSFKYNNEAFVIEL